MINYIWVKMTTFTSADSNFWAQNLRVTENDKKNIWRRSTNMRLHQFLCTRWSCCWPENISLYNNSNISMTYNKLKACRNMFSDISPESFRRKSSESVFHKWRLTWKHRKTSQRLNEWKQNSRVDEAVVSIETN